MRTRHGFTLVELLVVIAIVAILIALLIPAVQSARSLARRLQCANHQKQVALGILQYVSQDERLPAIQNPALLRTRDSLSWRYAILPFLEEQSLYDTLADGAWRVERIRSDAPGPPAKSVADVSVFHCPDEPGFPYIETGLRIRLGRDILFDAVGTEANFAPHTIPLAGAPDGATWLIEDGSEGAWYGAAHWRGREGRSQPLRNPARIAYITDGLSKTILHYEERSGRFRGRTDEWLLHDVLFHWTSGGRTLESHHGEGAHIAMGDGAVRYLPADVAQPTLHALLGRQDGQVPDVSQ